MRWNKWCGLFVGFIALGVMNNLLAVWPSFSITSRKAAVIAHGSERNESAVKSKRCQSTRFLPPDSLSQFDMYGAAWWQSVGRFEKGDCTRMYNLEDGSYVPIHGAGNGSGDVRMTSNWLEFAVEHLSDYNRQLDTNASDSLVARLETYVSQTSVQSAMMNSTLAVLPFQTCTKDQRVQLRVAGKFCVTALRATISSLVRHSVRRVVVVSSRADLPWVQAAVENGMNSFATQIIYIGTDIMKVRQWPHLPKTALVRLSLALWSKNRTWLGDTPEEIKYIFFSEPDQVLNAHPSSAFRSAMDSHGIIVPHRLELIPYADDFAGVHTSSPKLSQHPVHTTPGSCCNTGRKMIRRCPGELAWYKCPFPPYNRSFVETFHQQQLMRIPGGTGYAVLTMQGIGQENSFCTPQESLFCTSEQIATDRIRTTRIHSKRIFTKKVLVPFAVCYSTLLSLLMYRVAKKKTSKVKQPKRG